MINTIKRALIPIFFSITLGFLCSRLVYKIYLSDIDLVYEDSIIYLLESGEYDSYDNMKINNISYDYIYYEEDNLYKTIIGVTKNKDNIDKIINIYNGEIIVSKYYINDRELIDKINEYDNLLSNEEDEDKIREIVLDMLNLYKEDKVILTKIS